MRDDIRPTVTFAATIQDGGVDKRVPVGAVNDHGYQMCFDIETEEDRFSGYEKKAKIPQGKEASYHATKFNDICSVGT